jgi:hypothetical protein
MRAPRVNDLVRLVTNIPELGLVCGQIGAVQSVWGGPLPAFEVEFRCDGQCFPTRALLLTDAIRVVDVVLTAGRGPEGSRLQ